eukprot:790195-Pyramimonas_sp.AAC.1
MAACLPIHIVQVYTHPTDADDADAGCQGNRTDNQPDNQTRFGRRDDDDDASIDDDDASIDDDDASIDDDDDDDDALGGTRVTYREGTNSRLKGVTFTYREGTNSRQKVKTPAMAGPIIQLV